MCCVCYISEWNSTWSCYGLRPWQMSHWVPRFSARRPVQAPWLFWLQEDYRLEGHACAVYSRLLAWSGCFRAQPVSQRLSFCTWSGLWNEAPPHYESGAGLGRDRGSKELRKICVMGGVIRTFYGLESGMRHLQYQGHPGVSHPRTPLPVPVELPRSHEMELPLGKVGKKNIYVYIYNG